jgi:hypothetical protein
VGLSLPKVANNSFIEHSRNMPILDLEDPTEKRKNARRDEETIRHLREYIEKLRKEKNN